MKGTIKKTLRGFGLSEKEVEIYILLGKKCPLKSGEIAKQLKLNKGQVYRKLQSLQKKGVIESTLEYPARYIAVEFEKIIDSFIKSKREEVDLIEESKDDLLSDWKKISQTELESSLERFSVIEGEKKIFQKISQMIKETKKQFVSISSVYGLLRADHYGIFEDLMNHPLKKKLKFRFLTQLTKEDLKPIKTLLGKIESDLDFKVRDPQRGSTASPRMVIKDNEEILLFISDEKDSSRKIEAVLCTNCQSIIKSFSSVFQDLWNGASDIKKRIAEIESGKPPSVMELIKDPKTAKKHYYDALDRARKEILIVTSPKRLIGIAKNINVVKKWCEKEVTVKIMAPITSENLKAIQELLKLCEVKHIPVGYSEITIIDDQNLFQFNNPLSLHDKNSEVLNLENVFFTNNSNYIKQTKNMLYEIWINTRLPSAITLESFFRHPKLDKDSSLDRINHKVLRKLAGYNFKEQQEKITEKEVLDRFHHSKKYLKTEISSASKNIIRYFGTVAVVSIHPPKHFALPDFIVGVWDVDYRSSFGEQIFINIYLEHKTPSGFSYIPVASIQNSSNGLETRKSFYTGSPIAQNIISVKKDQIQAKMQGSTLFLGWTIPIQLTSEYVLAPSCILFEGYGDVKSGRFLTSSPSGRKMEIYYNSLEAFTTFFHPLFKYSIPGTEGFIDTKMVLTYY